MLIVAAYCIVQVTSECCERKSVYRAKELGENVFCNVTTTNARKTLEVGICGDGQRLLLWRRILQHIWMPLRRRVFGRTAC